MMRHASIEDAENAVAKWNGIPGSVAHIGNHASSVFSFKNSKNELQIMRFSDPTFRSLGDVIAELRFVDHLYHQGVSVAPSTVSQDGESVFEVACLNGPLICSSVAFVQGIEVKEGNHYWKSDFFKAWGRNLGLIHNASAIFSQKASQPKRWDWDREILFERAEQLIPWDDQKSRSELHEVMSICKNIPKSTDSFGLIHADHAPQNFRYDVEKNQVIAFDFGNCCCHWFVADIANSLSTVRRKSNREAIRDCILEGYSAVRDLPKDLDRLVDVFIRLRVVYVYLSRLYFYSENRTIEQQHELNELRGRVHTKSGWKIFD